MVYLTALWLPILTAAVLVFVGSALIHMVLPFHRGDYAELPEEHELRRAMREAGVEPGQYHFPHVGSPREFKEPEMVRRFEEGPVGFMVVQPSGAPEMGRHLAQWFVYCVVISTMVAYLTGRTLGPGTECLEVFRVSGTAAVLAYAGAVPIRSIWFGHAWSSTLKHVFDGVVYGLLTAGTFGWLWPA